MNNRIIYTVLALLGAIAFYFYQTKNSSTIKKELSDFSVSDTASVTKIFMANKADESVTLIRKGTSLWTVNSKYTARQPAVDVLLQTLKRIAVKSPVPRAAFENIVKQLSTSAIKVEIYQGGEEPSKVLFVGSATKDQSGTYMLIEGSNMPFITHIEGFYGFLTPRFFLTEEDWRDTEIFRYGYGEIASVKVEHVKSPEKSLEISLNSDNQCTLNSPHQKTEIANFDTLAVLNFASRFKRINFQGFDNQISQAVIDSVLASQPQYIYTVTDTAGVAKSITTFLMPPPEGGEDIEGNPITHNMDMLYGLIDGKDLVIIQYFVFDPLTKQINDFKR